MNALPSPAGDDKLTHHLLQSLRQQIRHCESLHHTSGSSVVPSGCPALDRVLPQGGFRLGSLVEWFAAGPGSGAATWALRAAERALRYSGAERGGHKRMVVIDQDRSFYPPVAAALGIDLRRLVVIQPRGHGDSIWALDQALRCPSVAAVWARLPQLAPRDFRRLQLAAEQGSTLGLLLRPLAARGKPSWSDIQLLLQPLPSVPWESETRVAEGRLFEASSDQSRVDSVETGTGPASRGSPLHCRTPWARRWRVELLRCRGTRPVPSFQVVMHPVTGQIVSMEASSVSFLHAETSDHERPSLHQHGSPMSQAADVHLAASLAHPAVHRRSART